VKRRRMWKDCRGIKLLAKSVWWVREIRKLRKETKRFESKRCQWAEAVKNDRYRAKRKARELIAKRTGQYVQWRAENEKRGIAGTGKP